ncbi:hypothetical protein DPEC_G00218400 [Dallia pectoralis]|uniref:Uncharacterized protein n=1 Tax=Dallia pectoralis TaxID=75939 RepID=A0ACC2G386_DALPE|nr:hypothetical protein DPEC_G00218400 [Dallia pectoralis]
MSNFTFRCKDFYTYVVKEKVLLNAVRSNKKYKFKKKPEDQGSRGVLKSWLQVVPSSSSAHPCYAAFQAQFLTHCCCTLGPGRLCCYESQTVQD